MALQLPPDLEQRVTELAHAIQREPAAVLAELVAAALDDDDTAALAREVAISDDEFARGEGVSHERVVRELDEMLERRFGPRPQ